MKLLHCRVRYNYIATGQISYVISPSMALAKDIKLSPHASLLNRLTAVSTAFPAAIFDTLDQQKWSIY